MLQARYAENQRVRGVLGDSAADPDLDQFLEDERIALFLQNEEFMAELRWNKDFLHALEKGTDLISSLMHASKVWTSLMVTFTYCVLLQSSVLSPQLEKCPTKHQEDCMMMISSENDFATWEKVCLS